MSNRLLEERIKILEREVAELKAQLAARESRSQPGFAVASGERRETARSLRESERDFC